MIQNSERAYAELVKRNCTDLSWFYPAADVSQCYGNNVSPVLLS